jgi:hypothetical protein
MHTPDDVTCSDGLDFRNVIKGDLDQDLSHSLSVELLSRQHRLTFQFLAPPRAIGQHDEDGVVL